MKIEVSKVRGQGVSEGVPKSKCEKGTESGQANLGSCTLLMYS